MNLKEAVPPSWQKVLKEEFEKPYFHKLEQFLEKEIKEHDIFPKAENIFNALKFTPYEEVKVLLLGQDPYHGVGQAHGLSFSVPPGEKPPPSLRNIYKELLSDLGIPVAKHGTLTSWARQGVLLLNAVLTVRKDTAASHKNQGWEKFTDAIIEKVSAKPDPVVFILWGAYARKKKPLIDTGRHVIIEANHPSPLSAHNGFFGSKPFSKVNEALQGMGKEPINWQIPEQE